MSARSVAPYWRNDSTHSFGSLSFIQSSCLERDSAAASESSVRSLRTRTPSCPASLLASNVFVSFVRPLRERSPSCVASDSAAASESSVRPSRERSSSNYFGAVPSRISYDNSTIAVSQMLTGRQRKLTDSFLQLQSHYLFKEHFCLAARGNEKGVVERIVTD